MKVTLDRAALAPVVTAAAAVAPAKPDRPILAMLRLEVLGDSVTVAATNADLYLQEAIPLRDGAVVTEGACCVEASLFARAVNAAPEGCEMTLSLSAAGRLSLTYSGGAFRYPTLPAEDYPAAFVEHHDAAEFTVTGTQLKALLQRPLCCAPVEDIQRPHLAGVFLNVDRYGLLRGVATNVHTMAAVGEPPPGDLDAIPGDQIGDEAGTTGAIVPTRACQAIARAFGDAAEITLRISASLIVAEGRDRRMACKLVAGHYFDYHRSMPPRSGDGFAVDRGQLLDAVKQIDVFGQPDQNQKSSRTRAIVFYALPKEAAAEDPDPDDGARDGQPNGEILLYSARSGEASAQLTVPALISGSPDPFIAAGQYVAALLAFLETDRVSIELSDMGLRFHGEETPDDLAGMAPMRLPIPPRPDIAEEA